MNKYKVTLFSPHKGQFTYNISANTHGEAHTLARNANPGATVKRSVLVE